MFQPLEEAIDYVEYGNSPFTNNQPLSVTHVIMAKAKVCKEACREWRQKEKTEKTWPNLKIFFFKLCVDYKQESKCRKEDQATENLTKHARRTTDTLQTIFQVSNNRWRT